MDEKELKAILFNQKGQILNIFGGVALNLIEKGSLATRHSYMFDSIFKLNISLKKGFYILFCLYFYFYFLFFISAS